MDRSLNLIKKQSRVLLVLVFLLSLGFLHTWLANTPSTPVLDISSSTLPAHVSLYPNPTDPSFHATPVEQEDEDSHVLSSIDEDIAGNDKIKSEVLDYSAKPTIAKVSMLYGQNPQPAYIRALRSHRVHNRRFNYAMFVLEEDAVGGFWNKPMYLLSLIMQELSKPPAERLQWLMWIDADLILVNPMIPLESFLPPIDLAESIHFMGGRDHNGLNTGTFFIRVSPWSVHMLNKALGLPVYHPEIDLGNSFDQVAMSRVLTEDYGHEQATSDGEHVNETSSERIKRLANVPRPFIFQPREWHNTYEFDDGYEGGETRSGHLLVHFPGLEDRRWQHMDKWLQELANNQPNWEIAFENSIYAQQIPEYWRLVRKSRALVKTANETLADLAPFTEEYTWLRAAADLCEAPLTNTSYAIAPGQDLLARMEQGISSLRKVLKQDFAVDDEILEQPTNSEPTKAGIVKPANSTNSDWEHLPASVQCTCLGECTSEEMRKIAQNPLCQSWL